MMPENYIPWALVAKSTYVAHSILFSTIKMKNIVFLVYVLFSDDTEQLNRNCACALSMTYTILNSPVFAVWGTTQTVLRGCRTFC